MSFLNPTYLWALFALAIPLAIHLWSRRKVETIKVGSTEFLELTNPKQTNSLKLNELGLLLLRMSAIALLVLIFAGPRMNTGNKRGLTYLVEPSLMDDEKIRSIIDSLPEGDLRYLSAGFPKLDYELSEEEKIQIPNYWQLAREMETLAADSIVVFSQGFLKGIKGMRPSTAANINLVVLEKIEKGDEIVGAIKKEDSVQILSAKLKTNGLSIEKQNYPIDSRDILIDTLAGSMSFGDSQNTVPLYSQGKLEITVVCDDSLSLNVRYLTFAFRAISKHLNQHIGTKVVRTGIGVDLKSSTHLIWLAEDDPPKTSGRILQLRPDELSMNLIEKGETTNYFLLTQALDSENIVTGHLVESLIHWLDPYPKINMQIVKADRRSVAVNELTTKKGEIKQKIEHSQVFDISPWLLLILGLLLAMERIVSKFRKQ